MAGFDLRVLVALIASYNLFTRIIGTYSRIVSTADPPPIPLQRVSLIVEM